MDGKRQSNCYGELAETHLPTGGIVKYTWAGYTTAGDGLYGELLIYRRLKTRTVYESDGTTLLSWTEYSCPNLQQQTGNLVVSVTEKDATGGAVRVTEHTFAGNALGAAAFPPLGYPGWREGRELSTVTKIPNSSAPRTVTQVWQQRGPSNTSITPASESAAPNDPRITQTSTTLGALTAVRTFAYSVDEHNNVTQECERDFGASSATRCVDRTYKTETAYTAVPVHLRGLVSSEAITRFLPAPQATEATVTYEYDGTSATIYADIAQFDPTRNSGYTTRGNITKETRNWPEGPAPAITEVTYDIAGNVVKVKTPAVEVESGGNVGETVLSYADSYLDAAGKSTYAFPTTVTNALGQEQSRAYHWGAARMITATDVNGQSTTYSYADGLDRLTAVDPPIGRSEFAYDQVNRTIQTKQRLTLTAAPGWVTQTVSYDGLGRTVRTTDAAGVVHGSTRLTMNGTGLVRRDYYPFGEEVEAGTGDRTTAQGYQTAGTAADGMRVRFTGKERDAETGLDYFGVRYFSGAQGRFTTPDPLLASAKASNPQTWNRYSYVLNNPLKFVDPDGLEVPEDCARDQKCTIVVKVNVVYDQTVNRGEGLTAEQKKRFEQGQIARAQKDYGTSNIKLDATYTAGSYTVGANGQPQLTGTKSDALNLIVSNATPNGAAGVSGVDRNTDVAVTFVSFNEVHDRNAYPLFTKTTEHEFGHQFLGDVYRPLPGGIGGFFEYLGREAVVDGRVAAQAAGVSQQGFREGLIPRRYAVPLNPEANKPRQ